MKKRILSVFLLMTMLAAVSCGGDLPSGNDTTVGTDGSSTDSPAETTSGRDVSDLPESYNLNGYKLRVLYKTRSANQTSMDEVAPDEANGDVLNDTIYDRNVKLFSKYNFSIENLYADDVLSEVFKITAAGDDEYDVALPYFDAAAEQVSTGIFVDLNTVPNLDLTKNYWDQNFHTSTSLAGKNFFTVGDIMVADDDVLLMILYNSDLAEDLGIENLYDAVREGRWTYDLLRKYVKQSANDLDGDGKITEDDIAGFLWAKNNCLAPHLAAVNQMIFTKDKDDLPVISSDLDRAYKVFDILGELLDQNRYSLEWTQFGSDQVKVITTLVSNKQVLFQNLILSQLRRLYRDVSADFGMLPMPKLDESQENYYTTIWKSFQAIAIPSTCQNLSEVGFILEALAAGSDKLNNAYYNICLESKYTRDPESFEMIELARQNVLYDIGFIYDWGKLYSSMTLAAAANDGTMSSLIASLSPAAKTAANEFISKLK